MKKRFFSWFVPFFVMAALVMAGCGEVGSDSDGTTPPPGGGDDNGGVVTPAVATLGIASDKQSIRTGQNEFATLTVLALDDQNAVIPGATIRLTAPAGALSASSITTDETGRGTARFDAGLVSSNQVVTVTASSGAAVDSIPISILGTSVDFSTSQTSVLLNGANSAILTATVRDGAGNPLFNRSMTISSNLGILTEVNNLANSGASISVRSNTSGIARIEYRGGSVSGTDAVVLNGPAGAQTLNVNVTSSQFSLSDAAAGATLSLGGANAVTLTWFDQDGTPVGGLPVTFSTNLGLFENVPQNSSTLVTITDVNGQATVNYLGLNAGVATITVFDGESQALSTFSQSMTVNVQSITPARLDLQVSPSVVAPKVGTEAPSAILTATVRDSNNNAVAGQTVSFNIVNGTGADEFVFPVSAVTNAAGIATTTFFSGGLTSAQNGVEVRAAISGLPSVFDTVGLTIGQQAARIQFGTTNRVQAVSVNGEPVAYAMPITVFVADNNGNPISNQAISLGLYPLRFRTGFYVDANDFDTWTSTGTFLNEDQNRNGILDLGEDGITGYPANGKLDPGAVATIPAQVVTDANGFAAFSVVYPKSFSTWVDVEITGSTTVSGSESLATVIETLKVLEGDTPFISSPFGP